MTDIDLSTPTGPPRYAVDGALVDLDPTIPDDIAAAGWFWQGGHLVHYRIPPPEGCAIVIGAKASLDEVWAVAREFIRISAELKPTFGQKRTATKRPAMLTEQTSGQLEMELV